jgi:hypothetical protein
LLLAVSHRWRKVTLAPDDLPLVVLWNEMLAATGIPEHRAAQLVQNAASRLGNCRITATSRADGNGTPDVTKPIRAVSHSPKSKC